GGGRRGGGAAARRVVGGKAPYESRKVDSSRVALVTYYAHGRTIHALLWGAVNALPPNAAHPRSQLKFHVNYAGGFGSALGTGYWRHGSKQHVWGPYTRPPLFGPVKAGPPPGGAKWAVEGWERGVRETGWDPG